MANKTYLSSGVTDVVAKDFVQAASGQQESVFSVLTAREREVLQLMAEGRSTNQIASNLHVSVKTIETHRQQVMNKLKIHSVTRNSPSTPSGKA